MTISAERRILQSDMSRSSGSLESGYGAFVHDLLSFGPASSHFGEAFLSAKVGLWECDLASQNLIWTDSVYDMFGLPRGGTINRKSVIGLYDDDSMRALDDLRTAAIRQTGRFALEARIFLATGCERWIRIHAVVGSERGEPRRLYGLKQDITEERAELLRWRSMAERDPLTGLASRSKFQSTFGELLKGDLGAKASGALVFVDLDNFKRVNDTYGHAGGDACLAAVGERLRNAFPRARLIARVGGDEFALLMDRAGSPTVLEESVQAFLANVGCPIRWKRRRLSIGASIGIAVFSDAKAASQTLICRRADQALYAAKAAGRNTYRFFQRA